MRVRCALAAVLVLVAAPLAFAAVTAGARFAPQQVPVGETADLAVVVQGTQQAAAPRVPPVDGLRIEYVGPETQVSIVNGAVTASVTHHFTVTPQREGAFAVGPILVEADGRELSAGTPTLQAVSGGVAAGGAPADDVALVLSVPRTTVYLAERVPVTVQLRVGSVQVTDVNYPRIEGDGFTLEALAQPSQRQEQGAAGATTVVDFRTAVTPARAGTLVLGPAVMPMVVLRPRPQRRSFFFGGPARQQIELRSEPIHLEVLPLPEEGRPADFAGAVGRFGVTARAAPAEVAVGDPITLTIQVQGNGNLGAAVPSGVPASDAFRVYPVQAAAQQPDAAPGAVQRTFEQVVIPRRAGTVRLPAVQLSFFDPDARRYRTIAQEPITVTVRAATDASAPQIVGAPAPERAEAPGPLGRDIVSIADAPGTLRPLGWSLWRSPAFWQLQLAPLAVWAAVAAWDRRRRRLGDDPRLARSSRAGRAARSGLSAARAALAAGDRVRCYDGVARTMTEYLAAKLDLPPGSVSAERAAERLRAARVPDDLVRELQRLYDTCEAARFSPAAVRDGDAAQALAMAEAVVRACERERRLARTAAGALIVALVVLPGLPAAAETPEALFYRGNALYGEGRYGDAAAAYEAARQQGVTSAALEYNLGNARLKAGDVGRAVLAYERARRLAPRDPDVLANLGFARRDGVEPATSWWVRLVFPLADRWTSAELLVAAAAGWWTVCMLAVLARLVPRAARGVRRGAMAAGVAAVVVGASAGRRIATVDAAHAAVVTAPAAVTVRFEPVASGTAHFEAPPGTVLELLGERGGWVQVERPDGLRGWVARDAVEPL